MTNPPASFVEDGVITEETIWVTADLAAVWLTMNDHNRRVKTDKVAAFASDMVGQEDPRTGEWVTRWRYVGDPIRFATRANGTEVLIDGQNRAAAIVKAAQTRPDIAIKMRVMHGFSLDDQNYIDLGTERSLADQLVLSMLHEGGECRYPTTLAALARRAYNWDDIGDPTAAKGKVSRQALRTYINLNRERMVAAVNFAHKGTRTVLTRTDHAMLYYVLNDVENVDPQQVREFLNRVEDGANMATDNPIMALRRRVTRDKDDTGRRPDAFYSIGYAFIAWNAWRKGRTLLKIQTPRGGLTLANYPRPI